MLGRPLSLQLCLYRQCTLRVKITCPKSRVLLSSFAASSTHIYCARVRTTVEDHGCTGQGKHATRTTTQRFSRPMPLLLLYHAPKFGCSSFFVQEPFDRRAWAYAMLYVNLYGPQLLYSSRKFGQVILTHTVSHELRCGEGKICCPGDCKEQTKRSTYRVYDSNQARTSPITKRIRTNETQNVSLTFATVEDCRRKQGDGTVGTRAVVS